MVCRLGTVERFFPLTVQSGSNVQVPFLLMTLYF